MATTIYTVNQSRFHGGRFISKHRSLDAALRSASKAAGSCWSRGGGYRTRTPQACCCGGPVITSSDPAETVQIQTDYYGRKVAVVLRND